MDTIQIHDKKFSKYLTEDKIEAEIRRVALEIKNDQQGRVPLFLVVLNGAFMFAGELFRHYTEPCEITFVKLASYIGTSSSNKVSELIGLSESLVGRDIVIVEDIVDTGNTLKHLMAKIHTYKPESIKIATLLFKPEAFKEDYSIDYVGFEIPNDFIVGYGLDYDGHGRNLPDIYKIIN